MRQARGCTPPLYVFCHIVFVVVSRTHVYSITGRVCPVLPRLCRTRDIGGVLVVLVPLVAAAPCGVRPFGSGTEYDILVVRRYHDSHSIERPSVPSTGDVIG